MADPGDRKTKKSFVSQRQMRNRINARLEDYVRDFSDSNLQEGIPSEMQQIVHKPPTNAAAEQLVTAYYVNPISPNNLPAPSCEPVRNEMTLSKLMNKSSLKVMMKTALMMKM
ncbi:uncharacterized protein LOC123466476 isoform X2 [Daphnia magna]|uniref:uncharacterized protein LOC123466476 isoform X2 n=1 Tax=Daphnia magna TaxID=35525 RepID=UPI001E1BC7BA|nr:uncharacterized protein LOC123466476 isoform X2 [Daphnia magna]